MQPAIIVEALSKTFKTKQKEKGLKGSFKALLKPHYKNIKAVDNISFSVQRGESIAFIGPNGAGKSTTLKMLTGILHPDKGKITVLGHDPTKERKQLAFKLGSVFGQKSQLWYHLPPIETYELFASIYNLEKETYKKRLNELIKLLKIESYLHNPVRKLSLGQRMRAELVAALLHDPEVILLDEPTIGLDISAKKQLRNIIKTINKEKGKTIILTSHDLADIEEVCSRILIINEGKIIYDGDIKELKKEYLNKKKAKLQFHKNVKKNPRIKGARLIGETEIEKTYELDLNQTTTQAFIEDAAKHYTTIADISIEEINIEEIVEEIYEEK